MPFMLIPQAIATIPLVGALVATIILAHPLYDFLCMLNLINLAAWVTRPFARGP